MFQYVLKRILYFIPTLFVISLLTFALSKIAPGDPVELKLQGGMQSQSGGQLSEKLAGEKAYLEISEKLGLNLPTFYFDVTAQAYSDTLYKIHRKNERENLNQLINKYGNWPEISAYYHSVKQLELSLYDIQRDSTNFSRMRLVRESCNELYSSHEELKSQRLISHMDSAVNMTSRIWKDSNWVVVNTMSASKIAVNKMKSNYDKMLSAATPWKKYVPTLHFYGFTNQYHRWIFGDVPWFGKNDDPRKVSKGFLRLDFGKSFLDGRPVSSIIFDAVKWTMIINLIAVLISYIISIPIGIEMAVRKDSIIDRVTTTILFILYSLPSFWIATMLVIFLTTDEYGLNWFPTYGVSSLDLPENATFADRFWDSAYHFILPVFCLTYGTFAFISRQMRGGMLSVIRQDYIRTAKAKGLGKFQIVWKHAFRNSLIPIITMFASLLPIMISGSVILEVIFAIPGMGRVAYESVVARNFPVLYTVFMFSAMLTMTGILLADLLYALVDPRISFSKKAG